LFATYSKILSLQFYLYAIAKFFIFRIVVFNCTNERQCCHHHLSSLSSVDINGVDQFTTITSESVKSPDHRYLRLHWSLCHDFSLAPRLRRHLFKEHRRSRIVRSAQKNIQCKHSWERVSRTDDWWLCSKREWDQCETEMTLVKEQIVNMLETIAKQSPMHSSSPLCLISSLYARFILSFNDHYCCTSLRGNNEIWK